MIHAAFDSDWPEKVMAEIFDSDCPVVSNGVKTQVVKNATQSHIHNVDRHFALPNVVISL